jgi:8-oxo-dGTP pyrophosphatase MutT (NUDIX family)
VAKKTSCGVIVTNGSKLLALIPTGNSRQLDIPKGGLEKGETPLACALRELKEETGYTISNPDRIIDLGPMPYNSSKNLHLFLYLTNNLPPLAGLSCNSYFTKDGKKYPEAAGYEYTHFSDPRFYQSLQPLLTIVQDTLE